MEKKGLRLQVLPRESAGLEKQLNIYSCAHFMNIEGSVVSAEDRSVKQTRLFF